MKCFKCCCITIIVLVVLIVGGTLIALNVVTPDLIGISDEEIMEGKTLRDLGLHDKTLMECITAIMKLINGVPESEAVKNGYTQNDLASAEEKISASGDADGSSAAEILFGGAGGGISVAVNVTDKEVAALVNDYIENSTGDIGQAFDQLEANGAEVTLKEITVTTNPDGSANVSTVIKMDLSAMMENMDPSEMPEIPISLPENLYLSVSVPVALDNDDVVANGEATVGLAGLDPEFSQAFGEMMGGEAAGEIANMFVELLNSANVTGFGNGTITFSPLG